FQRRGGAAARRQRAAERLAARQQVFLLRAARRQLEERHFGEFVVGERNLEAVAERLQRVVADLLRLVGDHLTFAGLAHAVALDGLGENDGRLALVVARRLVG